MIGHDEITNAAVSNYSTATPWPENDIWHSYTSTIEKSIVEKWLSDYSDENAIILNAGSG